MNRLSAVLATAGLAGALLGSALPASAAPVCADPEHPILFSEGFDVTVGTKKVKTVDLAVRTGKGCDVDGAVAVVTGPTKGYRVTLRAGDDQPDTSPRWTGSFKLDPRDLRNVDAGAWTVRYEVQGAVSESSSNAGHVRRATRSSFDAGPEPVRDGKLTFSGRLERASWDKGRYTGLSRTVQVQKFEADGVEEADVVELRTRADGTFRKTVRFPGASSYWLNFDGGEVSGNSTSRLDRVEAP